MNEITDPRRDYARHLLRYLPEVVWDASVWVEGGNYIYGTVDTADRVRIACLILEAQRAMSGATVKEVSDGRSE